MLPKHLRLVNCTKNIYIFAGQYNSRVPTGSPGVQSHSNSCICCGWHLLLPLHILCRRNAKKGSGDVASTLCSHAGCFCSCCTCSPLLISAMPGMVCAAVDSVVELKVASEANVVLVLVGWSCSEMLSFSLTVFISG